MRIVIPRLEAPKDRTGACANRSRLVHLRFDSTIRLLVAWGGADANDSFGLSHVNLSIKEVFEIPGRPQDPAASKLSSSNLYSLSKGLLCQLEPATVREQTSAHPEYLSACPLLCSSLNDGFGFID